MITKPKDLEKRGLFPLDGWRAAKYLGLVTPDEGYRVLRQAGWVFVGYDDTYGQELWAPVPTDIDKVGAYSR